MTMQENKHEKREIELNSKRLSDNLTITQQVFVEGQEIKCILGIEDSICNVKPMSENNKFKYEELVPNCNRKKCKGLIAEKTRSCRAKLLRREKRSYKSQKYEKHTVTRMLCTPSPKKQARSNKEKNADNSSSSLSDEELNDLIERAKKREGFLSYTGKGLIQENVITPTKKIDKIKTKCTVINYNIDISTNLIKSVVLRPNLEEQNTCTLKSTCTTILSNDIKISNNSITSVNLQPYSNQEDEKACFENRKQFSETLSCNLEISNNSIDSFVPEQNFEMVNKSIPDQTNMKTVFSSDIDICNRTITNDMLQLNMDKGITCRSETISAPRSKTAYTDTDMTNDTIISDVFNPQFEQDNTGTTNTTCSTMFSTDMDISNNSMTTLVLKPGLEKEVYSPTNYEDIRNYSPITSPFNDYEYLQDNLYHKTCTRHSNSDIEQSSSISSVNKNLTDKIKKDETDRHINNLFISNDSFSLLDPFYYELVKVEIEDCND